MDPHDPGTVPGRRSSNAEAGEHPRRANPGALLFVSFTGDDEGRAKSPRLEPARRAVAAETGMAYHTLRAVTPADQGALLKVPQVQPWPADGPPARALARPARLRWEDTARRSGSAWPNTHQAVQEDSRTTTKLEARGFYGPLARFGLPAHPPRFVGTDQTGTKWPRCARFAEAVKDSRRRVPAESTPAKHGDGPLPAASSTR